MINLSANAKTKILTFLENDDQQETALRLSITGRGANGFTYSMKVVPKSDRTPEDTVFDEGSVRILIDSETLPNIRGVVIDFFENSHQMGFTIDNPNPLWSDATSQAVQELIDTKVNPVIASHRGQVTLLDVKDGVAYIEFGGGCQGCGMANMTLKHGVDAMIREAIPEIKQVLDTTDHAAGKNPYYRRTDAGVSPMQ